MPSPERISILENPNRDAVMGINHSEPHMFKESYWRELLQWQINSDGERQLAFLIAHPDKESELKTFSFMDIRKQVQGLPEKERDNLLSGIIEQICQSKLVLLTEANEKKYIPIFQQKSHLNAPVTIKNPTVLDLVRLLEILRINPEISITCTSGNPTTTLCEVIEIDRDKADQLLKKLGDSDPFTQLRGKITVHESPKK